MSAWEAMIAAKVESSRLGDDGVGAGDERLGGDDRGKGGEQNGEDADLLGEHLEERVEVGDRDEVHVALVGDDPGTLAEVVEDEADLHERPGGVDVGLAHVAHVRVERLGAGGAEEHVAQDHEAGCVEVAVKEEHDAANRVEGAKDAQVEAEVHEASAGEEEEPQRHDRAKELADRGRAGLLQEEEHAQDDDDDGNHDALVVADERVHEVDGAQALDGGGDGNRWREDAVCQKRRAADHGRDDEPAPAALDEAVEREDSALVVVVRLHGHEHVLHGGYEGERPDDEREGAQDHVGGHGGEAAVAGDDCLEGVHRARADVSVHNAQGDENHCRREGDARVAGLARGGRELRSHGTPNSGL